MIIIKILGTGCAKCEKLAELAQQAINEINIEGKIKKIKDLNKIMDYNVLITPGLVINEVVKSTGKLPSIDQIKSWVNEINDN